MRRIQPGDEMSVNLDGRRAVHRADGRLRGEMLAVGAPSNIAIAIPIIGLRLNGCQITKINFRLGI